MVQDEGFRVYGIKGSEGYYIQRTNSQPESLVAPWPKALLKLNCLSSPVAEARKHVWVVAMLASNLPSSFRAFRSAVSGT